MWLSIVVSSIFLYIFHSSSGVVYFSCIHRIYFNIFIAFCFFRYKTIQISRCPTYFSFSSITSIHTNLTLSYMLPYCSLISITRSITLLQLVKFIFYCASTFIYPYIFPYFSLFPLILSLYFISTPVQVFKLQNIVKFSTIVTLTSDSRRSSHCLTKYEIFI